MAIVRVQTRNGTASTLAFSSNNSAGNLLIAVARLTNSGTSTTISDSQGNTWILLQDETHHIANQKHLFWYAQNCKAGANTVTFPAGYAFYQEVIGEYSGIDAASPQDVQSSNGVSSSGVSTLQPGSVIPTVNGELLLSWSANDQANSTTQTVDSGFTKRDNASGNVYLADLFPGTTSAINPTWTVTSPATLTFWSVGIIGFKAANALPNFLMMTGCGT